MDQPSSSPDAPAPADLGAARDPAADASTLDQLESELAAIEDAVTRIEAGDPDAVATAAVPDPSPSNGGVAASAGPLQSRPPDREETAMGFALEKLGQWTEGPEFKVEADRTKAYAAATNDANPAHVNGAVAPPVFAVVPIWDTMAGAMAGVVPPEVLMLVVHGEQDMRFQKPIVPDAVLRSKAGPAAAHKRTHRKRTRT